MKLELPHCDLNFLSDISFQSCCFCRGWNWKESSSFFFDIPLTLRIQEGSLKRFGFLPVKSKSFPPFLGFLLFLNRLGNHFPWAIAAPTFPLEMQLKRGVPQILCSTKKKKKASLSFQSRPLLSSLEGGRPGKGILWRHPRITRLCISTAYPILIFFFFSVSANFFFAL